MFIKIETTYVDKDEINLIRKNLSQKYNIKENNIAYYSGEEKCWFLNYDMRFIPYFKKYLISYDEMSNDFFNIKTPYLVINNIKNSSLKIGHNLDYVILPEIVDAKKRILIHTPYIGEVNLKIFNEKSNNHPNMDCKLIFSCKEEQLKNEEKYINDFIKSNLKINEKIDDSKKSQIKNQIDVIEEENQKIKKQKNKNKIKKIFFILFFSILAFMSFSSNLSIFHINEEISTFIGFFSIILLLIISFKGNKKQNNQLKENFQKQKFLLNYLMNNENFLTKEYYFSEKYLSKYRILIEEREVENNFFFKNIFTC